jgi:hypothetical protein
VLDDEVELDLLRVDLRAVRVVLVDLVDGGVQLEVGRLGVARLGVEQRKDAVGRAGDQVDALAVVRPLHWLDVDALLAVEVRLRQEHLRVGRLA